MRSSLPFVAMPSRRVMLPALAGIAATNADKPGNKYVGAKSIDILHVAP